MKVLIVYETNPEGVNFFDVEMTDGQYAIVKTAQGCMVNCHEPTPGTDFLNVALCSKKEYLHEDEMELPHACIWANSKIADMESPAKFDAIIHTGIML
ncbi:hypothetical protein CSP48_004027 [Salmonella enterica subsp. arizonae]|nr:hypothetical protein [Salmonella enterica subsp. arizonae]